MGLSEPVRIALCSGSERAARRSFIDATSWAAGRGRWMAGLCLDLVAWPVLRGEAVPSRGTQLYGWRRSHLVAKRQTAQVS